MKNKPYVKQYDMDLDSNNPNYGKPKVINPITKNSPYNNIFPFNRRDRNRAGNYKKLLGGTEVKSKGNNKQQTKGRKSFRQSVYSFVAINLKKLIKKEKKASKA